MGSVCLLTHQLCHLCQDLCLAFAITVAFSTDISSEDSLSLKLSMPGVLSFLLLLEDDVSCLGLVTNRVLWAKSKGFESRALVTEGTRTWFSMLVLSKVTLLDLSKLCVRLCPLEKMGEEHILSCEFNKFEEHSCLCCMNPVSKRHKLELDGELWKGKGLSLEFTKICKGIETPLDLISFCLNPSRFVTACQPPC